MCLVADHQVKMAAGEELALLVLHIVDAVHHGLIGGEHAVGCIVVLLFTEIRDGQIRQKIYKASLRLGHQGIPVSQEQDILHPAMLQQHITEIVSLSDIESVAQILAEFCRQK